MTGQKMIDAVQGELDRLTRGQVQTNLDNLLDYFEPDGSVVWIGDEQDGGHYDPPQALAALRALVSEGADSRDDLWTALEPAEIEIT
jgi:hypothetical protein